jgi:TonB family protein
MERGPRTSAGGYHAGDETDATGTMDPQAFQYVYRHYQSQIAACWSSASRGHEVSGVTVVRVRVGEADGHVVRTRIVSDSTHDAGLQACVQNAIRGWRYPRPVGGDVEVDYPLRFGTTTR